MKKRAIIILILTIPFLFSLQSQELISPTRLTVTTGAHNVAWTTGVTALHTLHSDSRIITQGFFHPMVESSMLSATANRFFNQNIKAYPNPVEETLYLEYFHSSLPERIYICNTQGKVESVLKSPHSLNKVSMSGFNQGVYIIRVQFKDHSNKSLIIIKQ